MPDLAFSAWAQWARGRGLSADLVLLTISPRCISTRDMIARLHVVALDVGKSIARFRPGCPVTVLTV
jgi:hypothetical protein